MMRVAVSKTWRFVIAHRLVNEEINLVSMR
jgi:hypothetical protein